jgi:hypothetical protein
MGEVVLKKIDLIAILVCFFLLTIPAAWGIFDMFMRIFYHLRCVYN